MKSVFIFPVLFFLLKPLYIAVSKMELFLSSLLFNVDLQDNTQLTYFVHSLVRMWVDLSFGVGLRMHVVERNVARIPSINRLKTKVNRNSFEVQFVPRSKHTPSRLWKPVSWLELFHQPTLMHNFPYSLTKCLLHYYPRHVSSINMPIFRRKNCIHTASSPLSTIVLCRRLRRAKIPDAVWIQFFPLKMGMLMLETCRG